MVTLNKIAATIASSVDRTFDAMFIEELKFRILALRATFIRQEFERNGTDVTVLQHFVTPIEALTDTDKSCGLYGCDLVKVTNVPKPITLKLGGVPFISVIAQTNDRPAFQHATLAEIRYACTRNIPELRYYHYSNNTMYFAGFPKLAKSVLVQGYFENPTEVLEKCTSVGCISDDEPFDLGAHMVDLIIRTLLSEITNVVPSNEVQH